MSHHPTPTKLWYANLGLAPDYERAIRADFDNDWHCREVISPPYGPEQVAQAMFNLARTIATARALSANEPDKEGRWNPK